MEVSSNGVDAIVEGPRNSLVVGDSGMFSWGVRIHGSDRHAIIQLGDNPRQINLPGSIAIEKYVWDGQDVAIMKDVRIGRGTVIGTRSVVTRNLPPYSMAVGA